MNICYYNHYIYLLYLLEYYYDFLCVINFLISYVYICNYIIIKNLIIILIIFFKKNNSLNIIFINIYIWIKINYLKYFNI